MSGNIPKPPSNPAAEFQAIQQKQQEAQREGLRQLLSKGQDIPRPTVRPIAPPQRIMPQSPPPPQVARGFQGSIAARLTPPPAISAPGVARSASTYAAINTAAASPELATEVSALQSSLTDLQNRSTFTTVQTNIISFDSDLNKTIGLLESARSKGYVYQRSLEEVAYKVMDQWPAKRDSGLKMVEQQAGVMQNNLRPLNDQIQRLNMALNNPLAVRPILSGTQTQINSLLANISNVESNIHNTYAEIETQAQQVKTRLTNIHWAMGQLDEASFKFEAGENLVIGVSARWDREGNDDPEGVLFLSNKRLIFERKEKVAKKKVLFITVASEMVQEVMISEPVANIQSIKAENKGLFGHQDFIMVQFSNPKLGLVAFHINGQAAKEWAEFVDNARTGRIESDRAAGSGLSYADLTGPLTAADVVALQSEVNTLQEQAMLTNVRQALIHVENDVVSLGRNLADLRAKGYVIEKNLEADVTILTSQWDRIKLAAEKTIEQQATLMSGQMQSIQQMLAQLVGQMNNLTPARPLYMQLKSAAASAQAQADAAQATVLAQYNGYADEVEMLTAHLEWVGWMLDALATASFRLLATESGVAAVEAMYARPGTEAENGILFLTDQRILWEDRVGAFELKLEVPLAQIADIQKAASEDGKQEFLDLSFASGAPVTNARFTLGMPVADSWLKMVGRARSGGYTENRAVEIDPAEIERIRNAPQQCAKCGASLTAPILRGQMEIACEYCGMVMRI
jgi:uncharacterized protein (DUF3084 family)